MSTYTVTIEMNQTTVSQLMAGGFQLCAFLGVGCSQQAGAPTVWMMTRSLSLSLPVSFTQTCSAFTSVSTQIVPGMVIFASFETPIDIGQILNVTSAQGSGSVTSGGEPDAITIQNQTSTRFTCGLARAGNAGSQPCCALPLNGNMAESIAPLPKILLCFTTYPMQAGTVVQIIPAPGILVDLTGVSSRTVSFDINSGWSAGGAPWATNIPANANLTPLLIEPVR